MANPQPDANAVMVDDVHRALVQLYDPAKLGRSPLLAVFGLRQKSDPAMALRRVLLDAIEVLKPEDTVPLQANAWRLYHILRHRYVEQIPQQEIAMSLALSERQLRRYEQVALTLLTNHLITQHGQQALPPSAAPAERATGPTYTPDAGGNGNDAEAGDSGVEIGRPFNELDWLQAPLATEAVRLVDVLDPVLETLQPVFRSSRVQVETTAPADLPLVAVHTMTMRQALLSILTVASHRVPRGQISIQASSQPPHVSVLFVARRGTPALQALSAEDMENLDMLRQLIIPSGGSLEVNQAATPAAAFTATIVLPVAQRVPVLVIDDNADAHQLLRRFLEGSAYAFAGVRDPHEALAKATAVAPRVILLDVMLPGMDGWELLGRLREHPATRNTPIIVCTILPHERLALTLGAAAFLRKPFTRADLLAALDAQVDPVAPRSVDH